MLKIANHLYLFIYLFLLACRISTRERNDSKSSKFCADVPTAPPSCSCPAHTVGQICPGSKAMGRTSRPGAVIGQCHHHPVPSWAPELYWSCQFYMSHSRARGPCWVTEGTCNHLGKPETEWRWEQAPCPQTGTPGGAWPWTQLDGQHGASFRAQQGAPRVPEQRGSAVSRVGASPCLLCAGQGPLYSSPHLSSPALPCPALVIVLPTASSGA